MRMRNKAERFKLSLLAMILTSLLWQPALAQDEFPILIPK